MKYLTNIHAIFFTLILTRRIVSLSRSLTKVVNTETGYNQKGPEHLDLSISGCVSAHRARGYLIGMGF